MRLSCEIGVPKIMMVDDDSALIKAVQEVKVDLIDTKLRLQTEYGIEFEVCPVAGHNQHGHVERRIRTVQCSLEEAGLHSKRLHATGLQTLLKLIENQLNNLPLGFTYGRDQDNTSLLKMLTPNMLRVGRSNERALDGPMRMPAGNGDLLKEVTKIYNSWFKVWNVSYLPKLLQQPKWFKQDKDLLEGDVVMFKKSDSALDSPWTLGTVDQLIRGRDGLARRVIVRYKNFKENHHRTTDRSIRSLVKIWSCDDLSIDDDLAELQRRLSKTAAGMDLIQQVPPQAGHAEEDDEVPGQGLPQLDPVIAASSWACDDCCCKSHCQLGHLVSKGSKDGMWSSLISRMSVQEVPELALPPTLLADEVLEHVVEEVQAGPGCECSVSCIIENLSLSLD